MNKISIVQGDTSPIYKFQRKYDDGSVINTLPQKMWITFKRDSSQDKCIFQKTLEDGINFEGNYYKFQLTSDDTCDLDFRTYYFDIAILNEKGEKKTLLNNGELEILKHYTKRINEA